MENNELLNYWKEIQNNNYFESHPLGGNFTEGDPQVPKEYFEGKTVLDYGCGFGRFFPYFFKNGANYIFGVDVSETILTKAKIWLADKVDLDKISFLTENSLNTIPDGSIDFIYSHTVFQHMTPQLAKNYFVEFERVLSSNANIRIQYLIADNWTEYIGLPEPNFYWTRKMVEDLYKNLKIKKTKELILENNLPGAKWLTIWATKKG